MIARYQGITELTAATVNTLIDKITVSERRKNEDGTTEQRITIHYKFVGLLHDFCIPVPKRECHMAEKACVRCGTAFTPGSNVARYCPSCRGIVANENAARGEEVRKAKRAAARLA